MIWLKLCVRQTIINPNYGMVICHVVFRFNTSLDDSMGAFLWDDPDQVQ